MNNHHAVVEEIRLRDLHPSKKALALAVVQVFLLTESEVTVMQRPGLKVSILVPKESLRIESI